MYSPHRPPSREQRIFDLGLGVEAVSLYLLCCGLADAGQPLSLETIAPIWNLERAALVANLDLLIRRGILEADGQIEDAQTRFRLRPANRW
ncbi:MAG: hypothetical protein P8010_17985 [Desulfosarcinaceae bacterium]